MRLVASVLLLACVSCGRSQPPPRAPTAQAPAAADDAPVVLASTQRIVRREPLDVNADTLFAEYVAASGGRTYDEVRLTGPITCYGGPALDGNVPVELYVRRAINRVAVVEDIVEIYPDDLVPRRRLVSMQRGPGESPIRNGHALVEDEDGAKTVQAFTNRDGAIVVLAHDATPESMLIVAHVLDDDAALDLAALEDERAWADLRTHIATLADDSSVLTIRGELPAIPATQCARIFAHFPAPRRR